MVQNHDLERNPGEFLNYKDGARNILATEWLLASGYGDPQVYARHRRAARSVRALLAELDGDLEAAATGYDEAAAGWERFGHVAEEGQALLGAGRCLRRLGRPEAGARLETARDLFRRLGAGPLMREAGAELREAAGA